MFPELSNSLSNAGEASKIALIILKQEFDKQNRKKDILGVLSLILHGFKERISSLHPNVHLSAETKQRRQTSWISGSNGYHNRCVTLVVWRIYKRVAFIELPDDLK